MRASKLSPLMRMCLLVDSFKGFKILLFFVNYPTAKAIGLFLAS
ncbi:hypothetical protein HPHPM2_1566 [Helicobacter pylori Hp M2]|uniref:Uncharacterized protein n=1 Tax=Helicobacter pylori Hp H-24 TaxID=992039 RepID=I9S2P3_HELPX|nr:hypothetical protein HPHPH24_0091 [Helicobacter pylori Hp H-24]EJC15715.1 hypothetical protein HPHPH24B_1610 [Helicobacter pylori Hp H-24b]EJC17203.1 hypothetical protein HPHPH24C_1675 [Helicobacter pylori Hp H-24c]EJC40054.1 hypothetical protein HPHPM2_1566 [Helicobacter pylori Hp M2]EJC40268.1 hypothetical protein HPHPM1_0090 [Helicobacter pylori Hp M1]EJC43628.1 hypothetical protein HPHPM3_0093 [Helicobacter pylori Hp M3]EJC45225.1 hypothetical protein HPHPM4_0096 [Helicobacter pylori H